MSFTLLALVLIVLGYLSGSVCAAILVSRAFGLPNPCLEGSKNPGATNVLRLAGKKYALMVIVVDILKGVLPVVLAKTLGFDASVQALVALTAVLGHMFPIFFGFHGGKGVATMLGAVTGLSWVLGVSVIGIWVLVALTTRYSSLSSLTASILMPFLARLFGFDWPSIAWLALISVCIIIKHRENIGRLLQGNESKIGQKKAK